MFAILLALQVSAATHEFRPPPPNILTIVMDDVGVDQVAAYAVNYPGLALEPCTPNIDQLAATGVRFTNAWSNPVCSSTRAQIMTGKHSQYTGVGDITFSSHTEAITFGLQYWEFTLPKMLTRHTSVAVGKWHLSDPQLDNPNFQHPLRLGFESFMGSMYGVDGEYDDWTKYVLPPGLVLPNYTAYMTSDTTNDALAHLATLPEPWMLYVAYNAAHDPFHCPGMEGYSLGDCQVGACVQQWCQDCAALRHGALCITLGVKACHARAMVHAMDSEIGRLLAAIDPEKTVVVLVGDNGSPLKATVAPFVKAHSKGTPYQGSINVPMIVRVPGGTPGVNHELVGTTDLFATYADLAGIALESDPDRDSVSFAPLLGVSGPSGASPRTVVFSERFQPHFKPVDGGPPPGYVALYHNRSVRNDRFVLVERHGWDKQSMGCVDSLLGFYRLADAPPQDPAFGPDPFQSNDLMPSVSSWSVEEQVAFASLVGELTVTYPRLPVSCP